MDKILELRYKKIRQQIRYLQTELEETKLVYEQYVDKFNMDFSEELMKDSHDDDSEYDIDNPFEKIDSDMDEETEELLSVFDGEVEATVGATVSIVNELILSVTASFDALSVTVIVQSE